MKLTKKYRNVLEVLADAKGWTSANKLPDGNGRANCASGLTLRDLRQSGLIEYGYGQKQSDPYSGFRITTAGRAALASTEGEKR